MNTVSDKISFGVYLVFLFLATMLGFFIAFLAIYCMISGNWEYLYSFLPYWGIVSIAVIIINMFVDYYLCPDYFNISVSRHSMQIKHYRVNRKASFHFLSLFSYQRHISCTNISTDRFEFYAFASDRINAKKVLHLYGRNQQNLVTFQLNISLISKANYRTLIRSLDKFGLTFQLN